MKKTICILLFLTFLFCTTQVFAQSTQADEILEEQLLLLDLEEVDAALQSLWADHDADFAQMVKNIITGKETFSDALTQLFSQTFGGILKHTGSMFALLCGIGLVCAMCDEALGYLADDGVRTAVRFAGGALCAVVLTRDLTQGVGEASNMMQDLCFWLENLLPVMLVLLATLGAGASVNALSPSVVVVNAVLQQGITRFVFPLILVMGAFSLVDALDEKRRFKSIVKFLSKTIRWALGLILTIFIGALTLKTINAVSYDALAVRTMKFTFGSLPMVGGAVSESMDTIISSLLLLKNGIGTAGVIVSIAICMAPVLRIAMQVLCMECTCAMLQMLGTDSVGQLMQAVCDVYKTLLYVLIAAILLFFVTVMLFIGAGNAAFVG